MYLVLFFSISLSLNDHFYLELESKLSSFAESTTLYARDISIDAVIIKLEDDLQKVL